MLREQAVQSMNRVILMGRLTGDPEMRYTQNNMGVARFSLAVDKRQKSQDGRREADFFNVVSFQQTAEFVSKYFKKGQQVLVEGRLQNNNWTDKDGNKRTTTEVIVDQAYFADSKRDGASAGGAFAGNGGGGGGGNAGYAPRSSTPAPVEAAQPQSGDGFYALNEDDEDLPF